MGLSYPEEKVEIPLDSNENLLMPKRYYEDIKEDMDFEIRNYPSPTAKKLKKKIAEYYGLSDEQVVVGNGSDAILDTISKSFVREKRAFGYFYPSYEMYSFFASRNERESVEIPLNADFSLPSTKEYLKEIDALFICSPNNPSGLTVKPEKIKSILKENILVVIDEAYAEYSDQNLLPLIEEYDNLILVRTFSKAWGLAGIRAGYALSSAKRGVELVEDMLPYNVNSLSIQAALAALDKEDMMKATVDKTIQERGSLSLELEDRGFNPLPSETNFLFCKIPGSIEISELYHELLERGIRIRTFDESRLAENVRITIGDKEINDRLLRAMDEIL